VTLITILNIVHGALAKTPSGLNSVEFMTLAHDWPVEEKCMQATDILFQGAITDRPAMSLKCLTSTVKTENLRRWSFGEREGHYFSL